MNKFAFSLLIGTLILTLTSCLSPFSKTPKGIDVNPLVNMQTLPDNIFSSLSQNDSALTKKYDCHLNHRLELGMNAHGQFNDWVTISSTNDTIKNIYRGIEIWQFATTNEAFEKYLDYRKTFKEDAASRIYKEKKQLDKRYFMIYKSIRFNYNHGFPSGLLNDPELILGFQLKNYFISISYTKYSSGQKSPDYYVRDINNDIIFLSSFLKDITMQNKDKK